MKVTIRIDEQIMVSLRKEAARQGKTMSELVEAALRLLLESRKEKRPTLRPLPSHHLGGALVDIADRDALYQAMSHFLKFSIH